MSNFDDLMPWHAGTVRPMRFGYSRCPVCGARVIDAYRDYISEGTLCESEEKCPNGCWLHAYSYGNTETYVTIRGHHIMILGSYSDTQQICWDTSNALDLIIAAAQAALLEDYWEKHPRQSCFQCAKPANISFCSDSCARKGTRSPFVQSEGSDVSSSDTRPHQ